MTTTITATMPEYTLCMRLHLDALDDEHATFRHADGRTTLTIDRDTWIQAGRMDVLEVPITRTITFEASPAVPLDDTSGVEA